jgi:hypothetical protein
MPLRCFVSDGLATLGEIRKTHDGHPKEEGIAGIALIYSAGEGQQRMSFRQGTSSLIGPHLTGTKSAV